MICSTPPSILNGLVRDEPRIVPPRGRMPRTSAMPSGIVTPSSGPASRRGSRRTRDRRRATPLRTTARITALRPGQSPPPVSTPIRMICSSSRSSVLTWPAGLPQVVTRRRRCRPGAGRQLRTVVAPRGPGAHAPAPPKARSGRVFDHAVLARPPAVFPVTAALACPSRSPCCGESQYSAVRACTLISVSPGVSRPSGNHALRNGVPQQPRPCPGRTPGSRCRRSTPSVVALGSAKPR